MLLAAFPAEAVSDPELAPVLTADPLTRESLDELAACVAYAERCAAVVPDDRRLRFDVTPGTVVTRPSGGGAPNRLGTTRPRYPDPVSR